MKFNAEVFHSYGTEPLVWVGRPEDVPPPGSGDRDSVERAYPVVPWFLSSQGGWGLVPTPTSHYAAGASQLFATDDVGSPVAAAVHDRPPSCTSPDSTDCRAVFAAAGALLRSVTSWAVRSGVAVSVGTELTLNATYPLLFNATWSRDNGTTTMALLYQGVFERIARSHPDVSGYWLWTPEGSMNGNVTPSVLESLASEIETARLALAASPLSNVSLTVSGWGLGPNNNRSFFDGAVSV